MYTCIYQRIAVLFKGATLMGLRFGIFLSGAAASPNACPSARPAAHPAAGPPGRPAARPPASPPVQSQIGFPSETESKNTLPGPPESGNLGRRAPRTTLPYIYRYIDISYT